VKTFLLLFLLAGMALVPDARAEHVYPFQGHMDLADKNFTFSVKMDGDAALDLKVDSKQDNVYRAVLGVRDLATPFFDMTTEIQSVVDVHKENEQITGLSGTFWSQYSLIDHKTVPEMSGRFNLKNGILRVDDFLIGELNAEGTVALAPPHDLDATVAFDRIDLSYFLDWISSEHKKFAGSGQLSGKIDLSGTPEKIAVRSVITSDGGYVENLPYDRMALQLQGIYPLVDLNGSTITKTNGFSFDLDGTVDLSDKDNMASQIASIKAIPLVKENSLQSEWILKRVQDSGDNTAETKYFLKKDKGAGFSGSDGDDYGVFGVERKIGF
jgi:hypothetical protein